MTSGWKTPPSEEDPSDNPSVRVPRIQATKENDMAAGAISPSSSSPVGDSPGSCGDSHDDIVKKYGEPVIFGVSRQRKRYIKAINESYWAALYNVEHTILYEPDERAFFLYDRDSGLFSEISPDVIKQVISERMLVVSREEEVLAGLADLRSNQNLNAVVSHLRGIAEERHAFSNRLRTVHLDNLILFFLTESPLRAEFSPMFRSRNKSPIPLVRDAKCPRFLGELLLPAVHPEDVTLLQKMAGQCLLGENLVQRFVLLDGESGRGKSQYANVIQALVGRENVTQLRTNHLDERFELFRFLRRTLLVGVDVNANFLSSKGAPVIKGLVGGDWFDAEQKGGNGSFQFQGKFNILMTSNSRLKVKLQDDVKAWRRRMLIIRYEAPPPKRKVPDFGAVLVREEGSGILNWALEGLEMLLADIAGGTGDIQLTPRQSGVVDSLLAESDSLRIFLRDNVESKKGCDLTVGEIVQAYAHHCPDRGWTPLPESQIGRQLPSLMLEHFQVVKSNDCKRKGKSARGFHNVAFINPEVLP